MIEALARLGRVGLNVLGRLGRAHLLLLGILGGVMAVSYKPLTLPTSYSV